AQLAAKRLKKDKVVLFCHSWGTVLGVRMANQRPDLFSAYVGAGQVADMARGEVISHDLLRLRLQGAGNEKAIKSLPPPPYTNMKTWMVKQRMLMMTAPPPAPG